MNFEYDMAKLPSAKRLTVFREMLEQALNRANDSIDCNFLDDDFTAKWQGRHVNHVTLAKATTSSHAALRDRQKARRSTEEGVLFVVNLDKPFQSIQDGRETDFGAGDSMFLNMTRAYETSTRGTGQRIYVQFPKKELTDRFGPIDDLTATNFSGRSPVHRLTANFFTDLQAVFGELDASMAERLVAQGLDLLALAMQEQAGGSLKNTTAHRSATLFRLKTFLLSRLRDPTLSLSGAAAAFGVSPSYINRLLSIERTSFGRFILEKRLQGCRRDLVDPARSAANIIDVAFGWGFNDAAHFSRSFKARFGSSPRDYQRESQLRYARDPASRH